MLIEIHSLDDPRLDPYRNLKQSNLTRWSGLFIAEGEKLTRRLLVSEFETASVLLGRSYVDAFVSLVRPDTPVFVVPDDDVEKVVGFNFHRGVLACGRRRPGRALDEVAKSHPDATLIVCPDVQDPENMGAMLRIGSALGITALMLGRRCADPFSRRVLRVSMGAALRLPIIESDDLAADLKRLQREFQYELVATVLDDDAALAADGARWANGPSLRQRGARPREIACRPMRPQSDDCHAAGHRLTQCRRGSRDYPAPLLTRSRFV